MGSIIDFITSQLLKFTPSLMSFCRIMDSDV
jgi:hypothetical protein